MCYKDRIVVPVQLREQLLEIIYTHQGVTGMMGRVEDRRPGPYSRGVVG